MKMNSWLLALLTPFALIAQQPELVIPLEHSDSISTVAVSPDDNYILSGSINGEVKLWNRAGQLVRDLPGHSKQLIEVTFSPKGNFLLSKCDDITILHALNGDSLWSAPTIYNYAYHSFILAGSDTGTDVFEQYDRPIFSPNERWLLASASDTTALAFNLLNQKQKLIPSTQKQNLLFSPNGKTLLSQKGDQILIFNAELQLIQEFTTPESRGKALFVNDQEIAIGYLYDDTQRSSGYIAFFDLAGRPIRQLGKTLHKYRQKTDILQLQETIDTISTVPPVYKIRIDTIFTQEMPEGYGGEVHSIGYGNVYWNEMLISTDGQKLILNNEKFTEFWDLTKEVQNIKAPSGPGYPIGFSSDSKYMIFKRAQQAKVYNWNMESVTTIPGLYAGSGLSGPRSGTWPSPITFLQSTSQLLIGQGSRIRIQDLNEKIVADFGLAAFNPIRRIDKMAEPEELAIRIADDSSLVINLKYNLVRRDMTEEVKTSSWENGKAFPEAYHLVRTSSWKNGEAFPTGYHLWGIEDAISFHGRTLGAGYIFVLDAEQKPVLHFKPTRSISDLKLLDQGKFLLISDSYEAATLWDFQKLLKLVSETNAPEDNPPHFYQSIEEIYGIEAHKAGYLPNKIAKEALVDTLRDIPRSEFLDASGSNFLFRTIRSSSYQSWIKHFEPNFQQGTLDGNYLVFEGHQQPVVNAQYINDGQQIISWSEGGEAKIWNPDNGEEIATLYLFNERDWVITTKNGLFDASPGSMRLLYYTVGTELIELEQLKERYYEPGLLPKLLGYSDENIRPFENFGEIALYPTVDRFNIINDSLHLQLKARNGGIGKVSIFINGKEVEKEVNPLPRGESAKRDSAIHYGLQQYRNYLFRHPDSSNTVSIRVYNEAGWLKSPMISRQFALHELAAKGKGNFEQGENWVGQYRPKLYVVSIGTSNYRGSDLDLQYADQDARMMADALYLAGAALFADGDSLEVHCLSTAKTAQDKPQYPKIHWSSATKSNIEQVFQQIKHSAKAEDIVVVYLSGHGVTYGGADHTQFYYLTKDIANEGELGDPGTLKKFTISSEELTAWINAIPALKQVLILDACNSGQIINNITGNTKRLNSSQIRALDRMKDRTGLFVLAGSASDKVSFEAGQYGQGLLTYALLKNMRGVNARSDDVDVMEWFQYARDEVPRLAKSINGIQTPMLGFPSHGASFDIGIRSEEVKAKIPIGNEKPVVIRSNFFNEISFKDDLKLADQLETLFIKETEKGASANLIYVDVYDYPNAYSLGGLYKTKAGKISSIKVKLFKGEEELMELDILVSETTEEVVSEIFEALLDEVYFNE